MMFGKRVIGEENWEKAQAEHEAARRAGFSYGVRVTGSGDPEAAPATQPAPAGPARPELVQVSIKEMEAALAGNPAVALRDRLIEAEFARPEGTPRKGALRLLLAAEQAQAEPRAAVLAELSAALKE